MSIDLSQFISAPRTSASTSKDVFGIFEAIDQWPPEDPGPMVRVRLPGRQPKNMSVTWAAALLDAVAASDATRAHFVQAAQVAVTKPAATRKAK